jgi:hypothetical protein
VLGANWWQVAVMRFEVTRNTYWIWFIGAAAWFFNAAFGLHHGALGRGLIAAGISALFLMAGMFFKKQARLQAERDLRRDAKRFGG